MNKRRRFKAKARRKGKANWQRVRPYWLAWRAEARKRWGVIVTVIA